MCATRKSPSPVSSDNNNLTLPSTGDQVPEWAWRVETPAFVYDEARIYELVDRAASFRELAGLKLLFAVKSFSFADALALMAPRLDGFSVSSLFEARLARAVVGGKGSVHLTTPGLRPQELDEIGQLCDFISLNSLSQWDRYRRQLKDSTNCGLRVNPQISFADDARYDPCRPHSKLGVPLDVLSASFRQRPDSFVGLRGILFHSNCDSPDFNQLYATVEHIVDKAPEVLRKAEWVNLGGGYLFEDGECYDGLGDAVAYLKSRYDLEVFFEPGSALVREAGYIVSTVLDLFESGGRNVAVLDTSVNHMPEVFEYGWNPDVMDHDDAAPFGYLLAGCTCLAGDLFGEYRFPYELHLGDKVVFENSGAYTLVKAHMFNGVALPSIYAVNIGGELVLKSIPSFGDFAGRWGLGPAATV